MSRVVESSPAFPRAAAALLPQTQLRENVAHATDVISTRRNRLVNEKKDWEALRLAGEAIRTDAVEHMAEYLQQFADRCEAAGGIVHWADDAAEARKIVLSLIQATGSADVLKIKSMTAAEINLNPYLQAQGIHAHETDLAELILQLGQDHPSHIVVPALHVNRRQVRELFARTLDLPDLAGTPEALTAAARAYLRQKFLTCRVAVSGANFLIAETGGVCLVESEGNGRMCLTLPETLITIAGIEKVIPRFMDLEVLLQTLPRSATGERMNPYNSIWTGVTPGDGPRHFHVVLLDNGRSAMLRDSVARQTLRCIRCGACQNVCPVYRQTGGHAYGAVYGGPIGAILTPQLESSPQANSLPFASSLCGACFDACPVRINIPEVLVHLRGQIVKREAHRPAALLNGERWAMRTMASAFRSSRRLVAAQKLARVLARPFVREDGWIHKLAGPAARWTATRDLPALPEQSFRSWWASRSTSQSVEEESL